MYVYIYFYTTVLFLKKKKKTEKLNSFVTSFFFLFTPLFLYWKYNDKTNSPLLL